MSRNGRLPKKTTAVNSPADESIVEPTTDKSADYPLSAAHELTLERSGIPAEFALEFGIRTVTSVEELPENLRWVAEHAPIAGMLIPWRLPVGGLEYQYRPDVPLEWDNESHKYVQPKDVQLTTVLGDPALASRVLLVEGAKQAMAARCAVPEDTLVIGIAGCWGALKDGTLLPGLADLVEGREVVAFFDADMASKRQVWEAANATREALAVEADSVKFARIPGGGNTGLDDLLGGRHVDKRARMLNRLIRQSKPTLPRRPPAPMSGVEDDRPWINVNDERWQQFQDITGAMQRWDAWRVFSHGDALVELCIDALKPLIKGRLTALLAETAVFFVPTDDGPAFRWPDRNMFDSIEAATSRFSTLVRLTNSPFVRLDGSICQEPGYDEQSQTYLLASSDLDLVDVPDEPTAEQVQAAVDFLLIEWLGDMALPEQADRANLLGLVLTGFVRGMVPLVPLALINGLQAGVAKGLLASCLQMLWQGKCSEPVTFPDDNNEVRKAITATLMTGQDVVVYDEVGVLKGSALAQVLTATVWRDRQLGYSRMVAAPNTAVWIALGNQVIVEGDMRRRVFPVNLRPTDPNPDSRDNDTFAHPDLIGWTRENRPQLLTAALTVIRGWYAAGQPAATHPIVFGSFEIWERLIRGVLESAGVHGFLDNVMPWRVEADFDTAYWRAHLGELWVHFGEDPFTVADVVQGLRDDNIRETPPRLTDIGGRGYPRDLGQAYARVKDRYFVEFRIVRAGRPGEGGAHGSVNRWRVERLEPDSPGPVPPSSDPVEGSEGSEGSRSAVATAVNDTSSPDPDAERESPQPALKVLTARDTRWNGDVDPSDPSIPPDERVAIRLDDADEALRREARVAAIAEALTTAGLAVDVPRVRVRAMQQQTGQQRALQALRHQFGFPLGPDAMPSVRPWLTHKGAARLAELAGPDWPRAGDLPRTDNNSLSMMAAGRGAPAKLAAAILALQQPAFESSVMEHLKGDRVHPRYRTDTVTGRWASVQPNIMGAGRRTAELLKQREIIMAERGEVFCGVDLLGIDARAVAGLSGDHAYAERLAPGRDIHTDVAQLFFGDASRREEAKAITHGLPYGRSPSSIAEQTGRDVGQVETLVEQYFTEFPDVRSWQDKVRRAAELGRPVSTGTGRLVEVTSDRAWTEAPARVAQAAARDLAMVGLSRLEHKGLLEHLRMFMHDELILSVPRSDVPDVLAQLVEAMSFDWQAPTGLIIPVLAKPHEGIGRRWADLYRPATIPTHDLVAR